MPTLSRRSFLRVGTGAVAGTASWVALGRAPALAQKRQLTVLSFNSFVPAADEELRRQAEVFGKQANIEVRVDTIQSTQLPAKLAAEAQAQRGRDVRTSSADPFLYEALLVDVGDVVERLGKQHGGWYPFAAESCQTGSGWRSVPWHWNSFPANYNTVHFKSAGIDYPRTWADLLKHGKILKAQGHPWASRSAIPMTPTRPSRRCSGRKAARYSRPIARHRPSTRSGRHRSSSGTRSSSRTRWSPRCSRGTTRPTTGSCSPARARRSTIRSAPTWPR